MTKKSKVIHYKDMLSHLKALGFTTVSHKGSHKKLKDKQERMIIVTCHPNRRTLSPGVYHSINKTLQEYGYDRIQA